MTGGGICKLCLVYEEPHDTDVYLYVRTRPPPRVAVIASGSPPGYTDLIVPANLHVRSGAGDERRKSKLSGIWFGLTEDASLQNASTHRRISIHEAVRAPAPITPQVHSTHTYARHAIRVVEKCQC